VKKEGASTVMLGLNVDTTLVDRNSTGNMFHEEKLNRAVGKGLGMCLLIPADGPEDRSGFREQPRTQEGFLK